MNLYRFIAESNHKAIAKVNEALGSDALIYSITRVAQGVEILASLPQECTEDMEKHYLTNNFVKEDHRHQPIQVKPLIVKEDALLPEQFPVMETSSQSTIMDKQIISHLNVQMQIMDINIQKLTNQINVLYQAVTALATTKKPSRWNLFQYFGRSKKEGTYGTQIA